MSIALLCSFLLGLGDSCFNTQLYSILGRIYAEESAAAFAIFKFIQVKRNSGQAPPIFQNLGWKLLGVSFWLQPPAGGSNEASLSL